MARISVTIPTAATWPTPTELALRDKVTDALSTAGMGSCTGAGGGHGAMDFSFQVTDEQAARVAITSTMQAHMPGAEYRVRASE